MQEKVVLDGDDVRRTLVRIAHEIVEKNVDRQVALVGIHTRGVHLASRLHRHVSDLLDAPVPLGTSTSPSTATTCRSARRRSSTRPTSTSPWTNTRWSSSTTSSTRGAPCAPGSTPCSPTGGPTAC